MNALTWFLVAIASTALLIGVAALLWVGSREAP